MTAQKRPKPLKSEQNKSRAIAALMVEPTIGQAAKKARVSRRQLHTWLEQDPQFRRGLTKAQDAMLAAVVARLSGELQKSLDLLITVRDNESLSASVRMKAALAIMTNLPKLREFGELAERVAELEQRLEAPAARAGLHG